MEATAAANRPYGGWIVRALYFLGGLCWLMFSVGFGLFLFEYMRQGAGVQFFGFIFSTSSVIIGVVHFLGLVLAVLMSLAFAIGMCAKAFSWPAGSVEDVGR
jgi:hypothetical protein